MSKNFQEPAIYTIEANYLDVDAIGGTAGDMMSHHNGHNTTQYLHDGEKWSETKRQLHDSELLKSNPRGFYHKNVLDSQKLKIKLGGFNT